ncbi:MAG: hypothetical protein RXR31_01005 [Thermoproteota archaeon]|jgi:hypothetical protein
MVSLIYRAGYIEDLLLSHLKGFSEHELSYQLKRSKHYRQIRYYVIKVNNKINLNLKRMFDGLEKPIILVKDNKMEKVGIIEEEFDALKRRSYITDGLNILITITKSIKRNYATLLSELPKSVKT